MERTFCIIKPDAVARNLQGEILAMIQGAGLRVVAMKQIRMTRQQAEGFYAVHKERPFFASLTEYMSSGPVVCAILEGDKAISRYRELMGATNPANAAEGTIRRLRNGLLLQCPGDHRLGIFICRPAPGPRRIGGFFVFLPCPRLAGRRCLGY